MCERGIKLTSMIKLDGTQHENDCMKNSKWGTNPASLRQLQRQCCEVG